MRQRQQADSVTANPTINRLGRRPARKMPGRVDARRRQKEVKRETYIQMRAIPQPRSLDPQRL
jgi:hypothetical protein